MSNTRTNEMRGTHRKHPHKKEIDDEDDEQKYLDAQRRADQAYQTEW